MNLITLNANDYLGKGFYGFHHLLKGFCDSGEFKDQGTRQQEVLVKTTVEPEQEQSFGEQGP